MRFQTTQVFNFLYGVVIGVTITMIIVSTKRQQKARGIDKENNDPLTHTEAFGISEVIKTGEVETQNPIMNTSESRSGLRSIEVEHGEKDHWTLVRAQPHLFYVFSAFHDEMRDHPRIRIVAAGERKVDELETMCRYYYEGEESSSTEVPASVSNVNVWLKRYLYCGKMIECYIPTQQIPTHVSVSVWPNTLPNKLRIHRELSRPSRAGKLCACVKPMYDYSSPLNATRLIEFIEFYKILGVQHFYFYVLSTTEWIRLILEQYAQQGDVTLVPVDLPPNVRLEGIYQYSVNTDCILRARPFYELALFIDIDEFIIPRKHGTLPELIHKFDQPEIVAFHFINMFFNEDLSDDLERENPVYLSKRNLNLASDFPFRPRTQLKVYRTPEFLFFKDRNKCIVKTNQVEQMGVHLVTNYTYGEQRKKRIHHDYGVVHHYRQKLPEGLPKEPDWPWPDVQHAVRDVTAHKYGYQLIENIYKTIKKMKL